MKLISCYIENFGLIHTAEYHFKRDLDCHLSDNGTGKTTLTAFIEAMLYGIGEGRKQTLDENPRKKYTPWQGGKFGGSLTLEVGKKKYIIERSFGSKPADDTFRLIDADTGRISEDYSANIGEELFGIDRDGFLRTAFLSEKNLRGKNDNKSISAKLSDLVGVDGDVGEFDSAIKLLDERRKFYQKKGGSGEIFNTRERMLECERRLDSLTRLEEATAEKENALKELTSEKAKLLELRKSTNARLETLNAQRERKGHEEAYATMLADLATEKSRFEKVKEFFAAGVPSPEDIELAANSYSRAEVLKTEALAESGNEEYVMLDEFFKNKTSYAEIGDAEHSASLVEDKAKEIAEIDNGTDSVSKEMKAIFPSGAPTREAIERLKKNEKKALLKMAVILLGSMALTIGFILGGIFRFTLAPIGFIVSTVLSLSILIGKKGNDELSNLGIDLKKGVKITSLEADLSRYEQLVKMREEARAELTEEHARLSLKVYDFLGKFPVTDADSMLGAVINIKHKFNRYNAFNMASEMSASDKLGKLKESERLAENAKSFLAKFPTTTSSPFTEIRDMLAAYNHFKLSVASNSAKCDEYAVRHGVTGNTTSLSFDDEVSLKDQLASLNEDVNALEGRISLIRHEIDNARADLERRDEIEMQREELEELYKKHVDSYETIQKAASYLSEACDNITYKYLGKTKEKFEEYSRLIAGADGEYTLNTSFELMRTEKGEAHGIDSYSRGIRDLYALGLRLALIDALYENEAPFIILDDPFTAFDDSKLARAKSTLKAISKNKQILYFTCSSAREIK